MENLENKLRKITSLLCAVLLLTGTVSVAFPISIPVYAQVSDPASTTDPASMTDTTTTDTTTTDTTTTDTTTTDTTTTDQAASTNSTQTESPQITDSTQIESNVTLEHDIIEINNPVTWIQTVSLSNETDLVRVELPADAQNVTVNTSDGQSVDSSLIV